MDKVESDIALHRWGRWYDCPDPDGDPVEYEGQIIIIDFTGGKCLMKMRDNKEEWVEFKYIQMEMVCGTCHGNGFQSFDCPDCGL